MKGDGGARRVSPTCPWVFWLAPAHPSAFTIWRQHSGSTHLGGGLSTTATAAACYPVTTEHKFLSFGFQSIMSDKTWIHSRNFNLPGRAAAPPTTRQLIVGHGLILLSPPGRGKPGGIFGQGPVQIPFPGFFRAVTLCSAHPQFERPRV